MRESLHTRSDDIALNIEKLSIFIRRIDFPKKPHETIYIYIYILVYTCIITLQHGLMPMRNTKYRIVAVQTRSPVHGRWNV
jgi:hypothetical protein